MGAHRADMEYARRRYRFVREWQPGIYVWSVESDQPGVR